MMQNWLLRLKREDGRDLPSRVWPRHTPKSTTKMRAREYDLNARPREGPSADCEDSQRKDEAVYEEEKK